MNNMTFKEYQSKAEETAIYTDKLTYPVLNLASEAGEVAGKLAKILRDKNGEIGKQDVAEIMLELGDVLWCVSAVATDLGQSLESIAKMNLLKLESRKERGKIKGSGDDR